RHKRRKAVWLHEHELRMLGFRRKSDRYWRCDARHGLQGDDHLSLHLWEREQVVVGRRRRGAFRFEMAEFHVTLAVPHHNLHFYFHEVKPNEWEPGGHTSSAEIELTSLNPAALREDADRIADKFIQALGGVRLPRWDESEPM
ncbi:MAG: hypothetical protein N2C14_30475, partial [Planctomycetales bacterium]